MIMDSIFKEICVMKQNFLIFDGGTCPIDSHPQFINETDQLIFHSIFQISIDWNRNLSKINHWFPYKSSDNQSISSWSWPSAIVLQLSSVCDVCQITSNGAKMRIAGGGVGQKTCARILERSNWCILVTDVSAPWVSIRLNMVEKGRYTGLFRMMKCGHVSYIEKKPHWSTVLENLSIIVATFWLL